MVLAVGHSCYIPLPRRALRAWEAFLPTPRSQDLQAQPRAMLRVPARSLQSLAVPAAAWHYQFIPFSQVSKAYPVLILGAPSSPPCAVPLHKLLFFVLSGFIFKFIFGLFSAKDFKAAIKDHITYLHNKISYGWMLGGGNKVWGWILETPSLKRHSSFYCSSKTIYSA